MTKLDEELERLSKAATQGVWEISAYYTGTGPDEKCYGLVEVEDFPIGIIDEEGATAESLSPNLEFVTTLVNAYRTGQLVPAMPSGDVVEAVARAIYKADTHDQNSSTRPQLDLSSVSLDQWYDENAAMPLSGPGFLQRHHALARAAITTYEAVSGVAKMREAVIGMRKHADIFDGGKHQANRLAFDEFARAALGEKP